MHLAGRGKQGLTTGEELHADRGADFNAPVGEGLDGGQEQQYLTSSNHRKRRH